MIRPFSISLLVLATICSGCATYDDSDESASDDVLAVDDPAEEVGTAQQSLTYVGQYYRFAAGHSGRCLDVENGSTSSGAYVNQYVCHGGTNQDFKFEHSGYGDMQIRNRNSQLCLEVGSAAGWLEQRPCNGSAGQRFTVIPQYGYLTHYVQLYSTYGTSQCVHVSNSTHSNGGFVQRANCNWSVGSNGNQMWHLLPES